MDNGIGINKIKRNNTSFNETSFSDSNNSNTNASVDTMSFTDILDKASATATNGLFSLVEGVGGLVEAVSDTATVVGAAVCTPITGLYDLGQAISYTATGAINSANSSESIKESVKKEFNNYESLTSKIWDDTKAFVAYDNVKSAANDFYDNTAYGNWIKENAVGYQNVRNVGSGIGYVGGIVAISVATYGVGTAALGTTATTGLSATMGTIAGTTGFGKGTQESWGNGASLGEGLAYGSANGLWEGAQFYAGGQINAIKVGGSAVGNTAVRVGLDAATGAVEGFARPAMDKIYKDQTYSELFDEAGGWKNVGIQGAMAAGMSALGEISGLAKKYRFDDSSTEGFEKAIKDLDPNTASYLREYRDIKNNLNNASIEEIKGILDTYNSGPLTLDGTTYHFNLDPTDAACFNNRYKELTGYDHPVFLKEQEKVLNEIIKSGDGISIDGQPTIYERLKNNLTGEGTGIEILSSRKGSYLEKLDDIKYNMSKASLEDVTDILDHYDQQSVLINGVVYHKKITPLEGASLNARYKELTGHDHPTFTKIQSKLLDEEIKNGQYIGTEGKESVYEKLKNNTLEIGNHDHVINRTSEIILNPKEASLEDISALLDYYDGDPVLIDGIIHHAFNDPNSAAKLNARFKELTGHDHPNYYKKTFKGNVSLNEMDY